MLAVKNTYKYFLYIEKQKHYSYTLYILCYHFCKLWNTTAMMSRPFFTAWFFHDVTLSRIVAMDSAMLLTYCVMIHGWKINTPCMKNCALHGSPKWPKYEKNCLIQTAYFLKNPRVSKSSKMKIFHSYQKEYIHKTSYSGGKAIIKSKISIINQTNV